MHRGTIETEIHGKGVHIIGHEKLEITTQQPTLWPYTMERYELDETA